MVVGKDGHQMAKSDNSNLLSNKIIKIGEFMYRVYNFREVKELELGNAYIFGGTKGNLTINYPYVLPYMGKYKKNNTEPGVYLDKDDRVVVNYPRNEKERKIYHISRIFEITPQTIKEQLDEYLNEVTVEELRSAGNVFEPEIKESDDTGIKAVRLALIAKQIELAHYLNKMEKNWDRANTKKALEKGSTLTFFKLDEYANLFEFDYAILIFDKPTAKDPISKEGKAILIFNDHHFPINDENIEVISTPADLKNLR
jgi:hypothetical protein